MKPNIIVGVNLEIITEQLSKAISSLSPNKVDNLDLNLLNNILPFLPSSLQMTNKLLGLKLLLKTTLTIDHGGWLYSHYIKNCKKHKVDPKTAVAIYFDGFFREYADICILDKNEVLFLGFDQISFKILESIIDAESKFTSY